MGIIVALVVGFYLGGAFTVILAALEGEYPSHDWLDFISLAITWPIVMVAHVWQARRERKNRRG